MNIELEFHMIEKPTPLDVSSVSDNGMKALIILATSLGWNVMQKPHQPVVITARDGTQKRLPTNTSIRMGVFQSALSTILAHTDVMTVPTLELIDAIIKLTKPSVDHQRRLRLAVGEDPHTHRQRVEAMEAEAKGSREPVALTTRIEIPVATAVADEPPEAVEWVDPPEESTELPPMRWETADKGDHGELITREPTMAIKAGVKSGGRIIYESDTSLKRVWEDGYEDYECVICGLAYSSSRGVGAHSQRHPERRNPEEVAWKRARTVGVLPPPDEPVATPPPDEPVATPVAVEWTPPSGWESESARAAVELPEVEPMIEVDLDNSAELRAVIQGVIALVTPTLMAERDALRAENASLRERLDEVEGEFDAFLELAATRRKRGD